MTEEKRIDISLLKPSKDNTFDTEDISDLVDSIRTLGVLEPLTVIGPDPDGKYEILCGERRYKSSLEINKDTDGALSELPCYVVGSYDMPSVLKKLIIEESNLQSREEYNREAHRFEVIRLYKKLADEGTIKQKEIISLLQKRLKISKRYSVMYMTVFREGIPELEEAIKSQKSKPDDNDGAVHIPVSLASRIAMMDEEKQREAVERINKGEKADQVVKDMKRDELAKKGQIVSPVQTPVKPKAAVIDPEWENPARDPMTLDGLMSAMSEDDEFFEDNDMNFAEVIRGGMTDADIVTDTTSGIKPLISNENTASVNSTERKYVEGWIRNIKNKLDRHETLEEEDTILIERFSEIVDQYNLS